MSECPEWREDIVHGYLQFFQKEIQDTYPTLLDNALKLLLQLVGTWKSVAAAQFRKVQIWDSLSN